MRVIVTGSRTWLDGAFIVEKLDAIHVEHPGMVLVHGACKQGADAVADRWAIRRGLPDEQVERHPAEWRRFRGAAGYKRNAEMVALGADICLAFIALCRKPDCDEPPMPHGSHGATHCAEIADEAGIDTRPWRSWQ